MPSPASAHLQEAPAPDLSAVLLAESDLGGAFEQADFETVRDETESFHALTYVFVDSGLDRPDRMPVIVIAAVATARGDPPDAFERFLSELVLDTTSSSGLQETPGLSATAGPRVGEESRWWYSDDPQLSLSQAGEVVLIPYMVQAVAFRQRPYFGFVGMAGPADTVDQDRALAAAQIMVGRMQGELAGVSPRPVIDCYVDPSDSLCSANPLPLEVVQRAVDFPIVFPCWVPEALNPTPQVWLRAHKFEDSGEFRWVDILYWSADEAESLARKTLSILESAIGDTGRSVVLVGTPHQIAGVEVMVQEGEQGTGIGVEWVVDGVHFSVAAAFNADETLRMVESMIVGCGS